ncbi:phosphotransferase [Flindersiella endophytica]
MCDELLAKAFGASVHVTGSVELGGEWAPVRRLFLSNGSTVVVKTRRSDGGVWGSEAAVLDNDRRGIELVNGLGVDVAPRLLAADAELGILVMSDVGAGPSVQDLLFGESATDATTGLVVLARTTGVLHAASAAVDHQWQARTTFLDRTFEFWPELRDAAAGLGFPAPAGVSADLAALESALGDPRFRVFVHGDLTPNNAVLTGEGDNARARLVDFEGSGFRHFGLDAACLRLPFPQYGHWAVLPPNVIAAMDAAYRAEPAMDVEEYEAGIAAGCAAWAIIRAHRLPLIARADQEPGQAVRRRTQIVQTLTSFAEIALRAGCFEALARWFLAVVEEMRERWTEARQPPREFPAYGGSLVRES